LRETLLRCVTEASQVPTPTKEGKVNRNISQTERDVIAKVAMAQAKIELSLLKYKIVVEKVLPEERKRVRL